MDRQKIETVDVNMLDTNWRDNVYNGAPYAENHQKHFDRLAKYRKYGPDVWTPLTWPTSAFN